MQEAKGQDQGQGATDLFSFSLLSLDIEIMKTDGSGSLSPSSFT
jgi:hypothetical protein